MIMPSEIVPGIYDVAYGSDCVLQVHTVIEKHNGYQPGYEFTFHWIVSPLGGKEDPEIRTNFVPADERIAHWTPRQILIEEIPF